MKKAGVTCCVLLAVFAMSVVQPASAALSPDKVAQLKKGASDVFEIQVVEVTVVDPEAPESKTIVKAKISAVDRSSQRVMVGEEIEIDSYRISIPDAKLDVEDEEAARKTLEALVSLVGPKAPQNIKQGWTGKVYLKSSGAQGKLKRYGLAAFGHSFEEKRDNADGQ